MKKFLSALLLTLMLLSMMLTSCSLSENNGNSGNNDDLSELTAEALIAKASEAMDGLSSFEANGTAEIITYVLGNKITVNGTMKTIVSGIDENDLYYYSQIQTNTSAMGNKTKVSQTEGFNEGKYFLSVVADNDVKKIYSENTAEEFMTYYERTQSDLKFLEGYSESNFVKNSNGTYTVTLSKYDQSMINSLNVEYGFPLENGGGRVTDCTVTITILEDFLIKEIVTDYTFSNTEFSGIEVISYTNYNAAQKDLNKINPKYYTEVSDALSVALFSHLVEEKGKSVQDSFSFSYEQSTLISTSYPQSSLYKEESNVSYGVENGNYYFDIDSVINDSDHKITYKDGIYKVDGKVDNTTTHSDLTSREFVNGLIDPFDFEPLAVMDITVTADGSETVCDIVLDCSEGTTLSERFKSMYQNAGASYNYSKVSLRVTMKDYELVSMEYTVNIYGEINRYRMSLSLKTVTNFQKAADL